MLRVLLGLFELNSLFMDIIFMAIVTRVNSLLANCSSNAASTQHSRNEGRTKRKRKRGKERRRRRRKKKRKVAYGWKR